MDLHQRWDLVNGICVLAYSNSSLVKINVKYAAVGRHMYINTVDVEQVTAENVKNICERIAGQSRFSLRFGECEISGGSRWT